MADLTAEFVEKILSLSPIEKFEYFGLDYTSKPLNLITPPKISGINVITLKALADLYRDGFEDINTVSTIFHVTNETTVEVYDNTSNAYAQRKFYAKASFSDVKAFAFGTWLDQEAFIIGLQAHFLDSGDRKYILELASKVALNDQLEVTDNGTSQEFVAKSGTALSKTIDIKPRVTLTPYRTFREITQPASEFIFRVRKGRVGPELALFEADGGAWKLTAMASIAEYLKNATADSLATVIY
jgi:hypothetical protein